MEFKSASIVGILLICIFSLILVILSNYNPYNVYFSNTFTTIINLIVVFILFYAAKVSKSRGSKIYLAWIFLAVAQTSFFIGDVFWGFYELGSIFSNSLPADFFYIIYYILFILAVIFFSNEKLTPLNQLKMFFDMMMIIISAALIFLTILIIPMTESMNIFTSEFVISLFYVFLDFFLFIALINLLFKIGENNRKTALFLLSIGVVIQIVSDFIYTYYTISGGYSSGSLIDAGWISGYILIGLAAVSSITN